jgi:hypothetical protein
MDLMHVLLLLHLLHLIAVMLPVLTRIVMQMLLQENFLHVKILTLTGKLLHVV